MDSNARAAAPSRIGLQTWGSDGDINPFIALAGGLATAGHTVTLAITSAERKSYGHYAKRLGFKLIRAGHIWQNDAALLETTKRIFGMTDQLRQLNFLLEEMFQPGVDAMYETARHLCAENDLLIGHFLVHPLQLAAEVSRKPYLTVSLNHSIIPTRHRPPPPQGLVPNLGPRLNPLLWKIAAAVLNRCILPSINDLRAGAGVSPARSYRDVWESPLGNLIAVSPALCAADPGWGTHQRVCGFFSMPENAHAWEMPDALARFLAGGPPPVYLTFGSMASVERDAGQITDAARLLYKAAKAARCRAIIQADWEHVSGIPADADVWRITSAPHAKIFPRCAAVVHHGGSGTAHTALSCGRPSVVVAHILDQYFWGHELKRLGVGLGPLDRRTVSAENLGNVIRRVLDDMAMAGRAAALGKRVGAENGVTAAVKFIESALANTAKNAR